MGVGDVVGTGVGFGDVIGRGEVAGADDPPPPPLLPPLVPLPTLLGVQVLAAPGVMVSVCAEIPLPHSIRIREASVPQVIVGESQPDAVTVKPLLSGERREMIEFASTVKSMLPVFTVKDWTRVPVSTT